MFCQSLRDILLDIVFKDSHFYANLLQDHFCRLEPLLILTFQIAIGNGKLIINSISILYKNGGFFNNLFSEKLIS